MTTTNKFVIVLAILVAALIGFALGIKYSSQITNKMPMSGEMKEGEMQAPNSASEKASTEEANTASENKQNDAGMQSSDAPKQDSATSTN